MKSLLKILYFLFILMILILLAGIFLPKEGNIESSIKIKASRDIIFEQINTIKNWENWSPWYKADTTMKLKYNEISSGAGASYSWVSEHSGEGALTITRSEHLQSIETLIDFGIQGNAGTSLTLNDEGKETKLTWKFENKEMGYFERYFIILFRKNMLVTLKSGLQNIKSISEKLRLDRSSEVKLVDVNAQPAMGIIDTASMDKLQIKMAESFSKLSGYLQKRGIQPTGPAFTIYYSMNPKGTTRFACCYPIPESTWGWKEYTCLELSQGRAATLTHWGKYGTNEPYEKLNRYLKDNSLKQTGPAWEVYINNPASVADTSKWETQIYYPVQ